MVPRLQIALLGAGEDARVVCPVLRPDRVLALPVVGGELPDRENASVFTIHSLPHRGPV